MQATFCDDCGKLIENPDRGSVEVAVQRTTFHQKLNEEKFIVCLQCGDKVSKHWLKTRSKNMLQIKKEHKK